ncbi:MAG: hypothetical protein JW908_11155 [Anaerolineales bacterium]|nr:hypothetical protein [Anaerolineales bacterium]
MPAINHTQKKYRGQNKLITKRQQDFPLARLNDVLSLEYYRSHERFT